MRLVLLDAAVELVGPLPAVIREVRVLGVGRERDLLAGLYAAARPRRARQHRRRGVVDHEAYRVGHARLRVVAAGAGGESHGRRRVCAEARRVERHAADQARHVVVKGPVLAVAVDPRVSVISVAAEPPGVAGDRQGVRVVDHAAGHRAPQLDPLARDDLHGARRRAARAARRRRIAKVVVLTGGERHHARGRAGHARGRERRVGSIDGRAAVVFSRLGARAGRVGPRVRVVRELDCLGVTEELQIEAVARHRAGAAFTVDARNERRLHRDVDLLRHARAAVVVRRARLERDRDVGRHVAREIRRVEARRGEPLVVVRVEGALLGAVAPVGPGISVVAQVRVRGVCAEHHARAGADNAGCAGAARDDRRRWGEHGDIDRALHARSVVVVVAASGHADRLGARRVAVQVELETRPIVVVVGAVRRVRLGAVRPTVVVAVIGQAAVGGVAEDRDRVAADHRAAAAFAAQGGGRLRRDRDRLCHSRAAAAVVAGLARREGEVDLDVLGRRVEVPRIERRG